MKLKRSDVGDGLRWLALAAMPAKLRARSDAVEWLLDDPVFSSVRSRQASRRERSVRIGAASVLLVPVPER